MYKDDKTPVRTRIIQDAAYEDAGQSGFSFSIPQPFVSDDFANVAERLSLSAVGLANQVNQVLAENLGNNMAARVKKAVKDNASLPTQEDMNALYDSYDFTGIRTSATAFGSLFDRIMFRISGAFIRKLLRKKGYQDQPAPVTVAKRSAETIGAQEISYEDFEAEVVKLMEGEGPWSEKQAFIDLRAALTEEAKAEEERVRVAEQATEATLGEIDLG